MSRRPAAGAVIVMFLLSACAPSGGGGGPFAHGTVPLCTEANEALILMAQSVQSATRLPCVAGFPAGWSFLEKDIRKGSTTYWLTSSVVGAGSRAVEVQLIDACEPQGEPFTDRRAVGADAYEAVSASGLTRTYVFEGGCVIERIQLPPGSTDPTLIEEARRTLGFLDRRALASTLDEEYGVTLCGAGAEPCIG